MAEIYPEELLTAPTHKSRQISLLELEKALQKLTQQVAEQKRHLNDTFQHLHQILAQREMALFGQLDSIVAGVSAKIEERRATLDQLIEHKDETEGKLQANCLSEFLHKQLSGIQTETERIQSEQISFPCVSIKCDDNAIQRELRDRCIIHTTHNPYSFRKEPMWKGVKKGKGRDELSDPSAICVDPTDQLIYVCEHSETGRIQVFTCEGKYHSTLYNQELNYCRCMRIHGDHIYVTTGSFGTQAKFIKMNKKGLILKKTKSEHFIRGLNVEGINVYICTHKSVNVKTFDLNFKPIKKILLEPISFDSETTPRDIIVYNQQIFVLFSYYFPENSNIFHPDPIQIFQLNGTLLRSMVTGNLVKYARNFSLDSNLNVLVSDYKADRVRIFSKDGILIDDIGREGMGEFHRPRVVTVDARGRVVIVDEKAENMLQAY